MPVNYFFSGFVMKYKKLLVEVLLPSAVLLVCFFLMVKDYFLFPASTVFGILLLPYVLVIRKAEGNSNRYVFVLLFFLVLVWLTGLNTLIYICLIAAILFLIERSLGRIGILVFIYLIVISPIFMYIANFVGVPARLELTNLAGSILNLIQMQNEVSGDLIITATDTFSVEPACMGLNMLSMSFMLAIVSAAHYERHYNKRINLFAIGCFLLTVFILNLLSNLIRIVLLILFKIPADNFMHDVVGIICLVVYILIPLWFITAFFYKRFAVAYTENKSADSIAPGFIMNAAVAVTFIVTVCVVKSRPQSNAYMPEVCIVPGYEKSIMTNDVLRFQNQEALIYVKPVRSFYGAEHTPMICWVGSGYTFEHIKKTSCNSIEIFTGKLVKGKDSIYCSWWFDNGTHKTILQTDWRWRVLKGCNNYSLINVNAENEKRMLEITEELLGRNIFVGE
jgi:exosortase N